MQQETEESKRIAAKWNEFLIEAQKSKEGYVYILNYIIILVHQMSEQNNISFEQGLDKLKELHKLGQWKQFIR